MTDSARTEEIRARAEKATPGDALKSAIRNWLTAKGYPQWFSAPNGKRVNIDDIIISHADEFGSELRTELTALREEVERLKGALKHESGKTTPTIISEPAWSVGRIIDDEVKELLGEFGFSHIEGRSKFWEVTARLVQLSINETLDKICDAAALSPSPAQQEQKP